MAAVARDGNSQHNFYFIRRHPSSLLNVGKMSVFGKGTLGTCSHFLIWQRNISRLVAVPLYTLSTTNCIPTQRQTIRTSTNPGQDVVKDGGSCLSYPER